MNNDTSHQKKKTMTHEKFINTNLQAYFILLQTFFCLILSYQKKKTSYHIILEHIKKSKKILKNKNPHNTFEDTGDEQIQIY